MTKKQIIELEATSVFYGSANDEAAFFEWLDKIPCVTGYEGIGRTLYISVDMAKLEEPDVRDIIALFNRYKVDMSQLIVFDLEEFSDWFREPVMYWHKSIFT